MKIAVVGSGISGLTSAYYLSKEHEVSLFEANNYLGGHTDTHNIDVAGQQYRIDTGFIVFNHENYPSFTALLNELGVSSQPTEMSFSVHNTLSGLEYNATDLNRLFCQRINLVNPRFYMMLWDLLRFYREAPKLLESSDDSLTIGEYLHQNRYSKVFVDDHLLPMACALWSGPSVSIRDFPARYFVSFMNNHRMLSVTDRPQWRVVKGGSNSYVEALSKASNAQFHLASPVQRIVRDASGVTLIVNGESLRFDKVVIATHSDQALQMLAKPSVAEVAVLGDIRYQQNDMLLHHDTSILPGRRAAWASWNVRVCPELTSQCTVSYHMNTLQGLDDQQPFIVSLNSEHLVDPAKVYLSRRYAHPIYNTDTLRAQKRWQDFVGDQHTYYCGAYWGWGFHEDGVKSALRVITHINQYRTIAEGNVHVG